MKTTKTSFCFLPRKLIIHTEHGLFDIGWVWWKTVELKYNINNGWVCFINPTEHVRKVITNTNSKNKLYKGAIVNTPLGILERTGTIKEFTYDGNYAKVQCKDNVYVFSVQDIYSAF